MATAGTLLAPSFSGNSNLGRAVPIKWQLFRHLRQQRDRSGFDDDSEGRRVPRRLLGTGDGRGATLLYSPTCGATGGSTFRSTSSEFIFNWDTSRSSRGPGCYTLVLQLNDGSAAEGDDPHLQ